MTRAVLFLLLLCAPAVSAQLAISGDLKVKPHRMAVLSAKGFPEGAALIWDFDEEKLHGEEAAGRLYLAGPPGSYRIKLRALVLKDGATHATTARAEVVFDGVAPPPMPPAPPDKPTPPPPAPPGKADPLAALGRLTMGSAGCTCTVIGPRRADGKWDILTANHCLPRGVTKGTVRTKDGKTLAVTMQAREAGSDLAWLLTDNPVEGLAFAVLAAKAPEPGTAIWHAGYGFDRPGNVEEGRVLGGEAGNRQISMELNVSSGDSGGGIFRKDTGELVSAVCCTRVIARKTTMWGGSSVRALELRPKAPSSLEDDADPSGHGGCVHPFIDLSRFDWSGEAKAKE